MTETPARYGHLLTIPDAAARLRVSESTVWRWVYGGKLPSVKLGKARRIRAESLERFVEQGETRSDPVFLSEAQSATPEAFRRALKPFTFDNPLWKTVGMVRGDGAPVSENIHHYVGEAVAAHLGLPPGPPLPPIAEPAAKPRSAARRSPKAGQRRAAERVGRRAPKPR